MTIKAIVSSATIALLFATTTFAQVAEPTTTSTGIPTNGQMQIPSTGAPTKQKDKKEKPQGRGNSDWGKAQKQKHAEGRNDGEAHGKGQSKDKGMRAEGKQGGYDDHDGKKGHDDDQDERGDGDHKGTGEGSNKEHTGKNGQMHKEHGNKDEMEKGDATKTDVDPKSLKSSKSKVKSN